LLEASEARHVFVGVCLSFVLWYVVFRTTILGSFWYRLTFASIILALYAVYFGKAIDRGDHEIGLSVVMKGVVSGCFLYALFFVGYNVFKAFVESGASGVYLFRADSAIHVVALSLVITSFCEEFFWRRYIQAALIGSYGGTGLVFNTLLYACIHLPTGNPALVFAALIAGLFWGLLYEYTGSLWVAVLSHVVWTELVFVFLPLK
jgi:membrane protease YdiL (CAAX protease family)